MGGGSRQYIGNTICASIVDGEDDVRFTIKCLVQWMPAGRWLLTVICTLLNAGTWYLGSSTRHSSSPYIRISKRTDKLHCPPRSSSTMASSSIAHLSNQLTALADSLRTTNTLITQLSKLHFQPGSEPLDNDSSTVRVELSQDIHDSLKQLEEDLDLLQQEAQDLAAPTGSSSSASVTPHLPLHTARRRETLTTERERERARVAASLARLTEGLKASRSHFRRAQLTAKKNSDAAKQKERELVFASLSNPPPSADPSQPVFSNEEARTSLFAGRRALAQKSKGTQADLELSASTSVTASLRRTHDLLSTELSRSRFARETFEESSAALAELGERYTDLDTVLAKSRDLLGTLLRSQKSDTWYLETAFYILCGTLIWLVFRRLLLGPFIRLPLFVVRWFLWKPFVIFLNLTGILYSSNPGAVQSADVPAGPRTPLIVKNSARGVATPVPKMSAGAAKERGVPAGMGGGGAKVGQDEGVAEKIGRMAEESQQQAEGQQPVQRGDGTVLKERGTEPRNPRKKVFEDDGSGSGGRDEL